MRIAFIHTQRVQIVWRIGLILISFLVVFWFIWGLEWWLLAFASGCGVIYQVYWLFKYLDLTNRELIRFLTAIKYEDFQQSFPVREAGGSAKELYDCFHEVFSLFKKSREDGEQNSRYLHSILQHIDIGLMSIRTDGGIDFINRAGRNLLKIARLESVSDLAVYYNAEFVQSLQQIHHGQKLTVPVEGVGVRFQALMYASDLRIGDRYLKLVTLQNIDKVLDDKEQDAWQSLVKVLTHEIMNSMTPIASLSDTATNMMARKGSTEQLDQETLADIFDALNTIRNRSVGLIEFIKVYRNLTLIPKPSLKIIFVRSLTDQVTSLLADRLEKGRIAWVVRIDPESLTITADAALIEQVLLNLSLNAIDAVKGIENPRIELQAYLDDNGHTAMAISDNGCGIAETARGKIFIPFFSTKEEGSGIGLSFSRQVMRLHQGHIELAPPSKAGACFILTF